MLALGCGLGILGAWGTALGLPMEGEILDQFNRGGIRMGSGRMDVNGASVAVGFALWTMFTLFLPIAWLGKSSRRLWPTMVLFIILLLCGVPLLTMGSRGGLGYLVFGGFGVFFYALSVRLLSGRTLKFALVGVWSTLILLPLLGPALWETQAGRMLQVTLQYNKEQAEETGGGSLAAGRADIWSHVLGRGRLPSNRCS